MKHLGMEDTEIPLDQEGRPMHLGANKDELANRIIIVGDYERCALVAENLTNVKKIESKRKFLTYTGLYNGVPVSIICGGMGVSITDFTIRESRQVVPGPMAIIRLGSCGVVHEDVEVGNLIVPDTAIMVQQNFFDDSGPFLLAKPAHADPKLTEQIVKDLKDNSSGYYKVFTGGVVASTDSFYASQGRQSDCFDQNCKELIPTIKKKHPNHHIFEMEAYYLYKLAEMSAKDKKIYAGCACIGLFHRMKGIIVEKHKVKALEIIGSKGLLDAITNFKFPEKEPENTERVKSILLKH